MLIVTNRLENTGMKVFRVISMSIKYIGKFSAKLEN